MPQAEPQELVVAGASDAVRAQVSPALQVVAGSNLVVRAAPEAVKGPAVGHALWAQVDRPWIGPGLFRLG
ncbi:MAG: hypothetical protein ABIZ30_03365, partial [Candidatus Limnocylindrales bacterium]